jgi:hypothetical protein
MGEHDELIASDDEFHSPRYRSILFLLRGAIEQCVQHADTLAVGGWRRRVAAASAK